MNTQLNMYRVGLPWRVLGSLLLILAMFALLVGSYTDVLAKESIRVGLVFDNPVGPNDKSFNEMSYAGLLQAQAKLGVIGSTYTPSSTEDIENQIRQCAADGNALCLSVGFLTGDAARTVAMEYHQVAFAVIDWGVDEGLYNLRSIAFHEKQVGYLAGIVAGKMTTSNKLGVVGGMEIPPVVNFSEGFRNAAQCNNPNAEVWIEYVGAFDNPELGAYWAEQMVAWNADVIFNVAGPTGNGAILRGAELGAWVVGVDNDQYLSVFGGGSVPYSDRILTSAMKRVDVAVFSTIDDVTKGRFTPGIKLYDLGNNGVGLAPLHEASDNIPAYVVKLLEKTRKAIIAGKLNIDNSCR